MTIVMDPMVAAAERPMVFRRYRVIVESPDGTKTKPMSFNKWHNQLFPNEWPVAAVRAKTVTPDQERGDIRSTGWVDYLGHQFRFHFIRIK